GRSHQKTPASCIPKSPDLITGSLKPEHGIEAVERNANLAMSRVARAGRCEARHTACFRDSFFQQLAVLFLVVAQQQVGIDRFVELPHGRVNAYLAEQGVHAESSG